MEVVEKKKELIPKLRFKEFQDSWKKSIINNEAAKLKVGFVGTCEPFYTSKEEGVLLVRTGNLKGVNIVLDEEKYVTREFHEKNTKSQLYEGDLILARHGGNGEICRIPDNFPEANCLNIVVLRTKESINSHFFQTLYSTFSVQKKILSVTAGSTQTVINTKEIGKLKISFPTLPEQQKIASFLSAVDEKIQQLTAKKNLLDQYKKGVMQKLFSGKIRFKDENGNDFPDWEEKRLGEVCEMTSSKRVYLSDYVDNGIPFYRGKEISELRLNQTPSDVLYITEERYNDYKFKYGVPQKNDILVTAVGTLGNVLRVRNNDSFYFKDGNLIWLRKIKENSFFIEILLQWNTRELLKTSIGSTQKALTMVELRKLKFDFPSPKEQQKIATYLSSLDTKIETVNKRITQTQTFKKGLLQQMFI
jgi:restriction endonuclease S subunit